MREENNNCKPLGEWREQVLQRMKEEQDRRIECGTTCEHCKHWEYRKEMLKNSVERGIIKGIKPIDLNPDGYCDYWEAKDDNEHIILHNNKEYDKS